MKAFIIILFLFSFFSQAQISLEAKDSITHAINLLNKGNSGNEANELLLKYQDFIESDTTKIKLYSEVAISKGNSRDINEAVEYANKALELSIQADGFYRVEIENILGFIHQLLGDKKKSIFHKKQVLNKSKSSYVKLGVYREIVRSYLSINKDSAHHYANEAITKYENVIFTDSISEKVLYEIKIFKELTGAASRQSLIQLYKNGIDSKILDNNGKNNIFLGVYYKELGQYDSSLHYFNITINKCIEEKDTINIIMAYERLIDLYKKLEDTSGMNETIVLLHNYRFFHEKLDLVKYNELVLMYNQIKDNEKTEGNIYYWVLVVLFLVFLFMFFLLKKTNKKHKAVGEIEISQSVSKKIDTSLKELEKNKAFLNPDFNMTYLEAIIGVNRKYIGLFFKTEAETSLIDYTNTLRIKHAENRLNDPHDKFKKYSIEKMANELGYKTPATFKKYFKKYSDVLLLSNKN